MNILLAVILTVTSTTDLTNSHKVQPLLARVAENQPAIKLTYTWEVGVVGHKLTVEATKMLDSQGLILFATADDEIALAVNKTHFLYAKKITEKKP